MQYFSVVKTLKWLKLYQSCVKVHKNIVARSTVTNSGNK